MSYERTQYFSSERADLGSAELETIYEKFRKKKTQGKIPYDAALFVLPKTQNASYIIKLHKFIGLDQITLLRRVGVAEIAHHEKYIPVKQQQLTSEEFERQKEKFSQIVIPAKHVPLLKPKHAVAGFIFALHPIGIAVAAGMTAELAIHMAIVGMANPVIAGVLATIAIAAGIATLAVMVGAIVGFMLDRRDKVNCPVQFGKLQQMWKPTEVVAASVPTDGATAVLKLDNQ